VDGYTYMIERNKLMIQTARSREEESFSEPQPTPVGAKDPIPWRDSLMELYSKLEACGRTEGHDSQ
jgi:hypothetical protein